MARELIEFECNDCKPTAWFIVNINLSLEGAFKFVCPKCGAEHQRYVHKGQMRAEGSEVHYVGGKTKIEVDRSGSGGDRICPPLSSWSQKPRLNLLMKVRCGYMGEAWVRKAAAEKGIDLLAEKEA